MEVLVYSPSTGTEEVVGKGVRHWAYIKGEKAQNIKQACRTVTTMIRGLDSLVILNQYIMLRTMDCEEASPAFGVWVSKWKRKGRRRGLLATHMRILDLAHIPSGGRPRVQQLGQQWRRCSDPREDARGSSTPEFQECCSQDGKPPLPLNPGITNIELRRDDV